MSAPSSILRSAAVVGFMTALSRLLGLVREMAMAFVFGTSALKSAFDIAFVVPNLFRRLFGEGALSSAFVPVFSESVSKDGTERAYAFAVRVISLLALVLGLITLVGILLTYPAADLLPKSGPWARWVLPLPMMRIMLPYALLICVAAVLSGILNTFGRFAISSLTPLLLNAVWLAAIVGAAVCVKGTDNPAQQAKLMIIAWSVVVAGVVQIAFQLPALARRGFHFRFDFHGIWSDKKIRRVLVLMGPAALGMGLVQINVCVDKVLAFWADPQAPAALEYAERLVYLPLGMFGTAFMTVLLPAFSRFAATGDRESIRLGAERALRNLSLIMAPCACALVCLSYPVIHLIYNMKGGSFDAESNMLSARALACYAPGLVVFCFQKVLTPAFYALQDLKTPVKISLGCLFLNITLNILSVICLPHGWKHAGIAGSTVLCSAVNGTALAILLRRHGISLHYRAFAFTTLKSLLAAGVMAVGAFCALRALASWAAVSKFAEIGVMLGVVGAAAGVYLVLILLCARAELREMAGDLLSRRRRK